MKTQVWQAIPRESDRSGFEPVEPHWMATKRAAAMHDPRVPHFWWSEEVLFSVGYFTAREALAFALTLERIGNIRMAPQRDRARSPFNELIDLNDLSTVIDLAQRGPFAWTPDRNGGMVLASGITADTLTMLGNLSKTNPPGEPPEGCDLSERAEIRRLGIWPNASVTVGANTIEMTWWGWRAVLCRFARQGMQPSDPEWKVWLRFYAYYDSERALDWWNTGYLRISKFSERDTAMLKLALLKYLAQPDAALERLQTYPATDQPADVLLTLRSVLIEEVQSVLDLCEHGSLCWTLYSDGIVHLTRR